MAYSGILPRVKSRARVMLSISAAVMTLSQPVQRLAQNITTAQSDWITFVPANDDIWTGNLSAQGAMFTKHISSRNLNKKPIAKRGKAFLRLGYQYYDFKYTGSNNWMGAPQKISDMTKAGPGLPQFYEVID